MLTIRYLPALVLMSLCVIAAPVSSQTAPKRADLDRADAAFLKQAAENGHAEVQSSQLALRKLAPSSRIREFAQMMINDHQRSGSELKQLAAARGVKVSDEPSLLQRARIKMMSANEGDEFALKYMRTMGVDAHEETIEMFRKAAAEADDADVRAFASRTLPILQRHLEHARELLSSMEGTHRESSGDAGRGSSAPGTAPAAPSPTRP